VTVYSGKVDLGTGVRTALSQMVAEELDVPINKVSVIEGDTALTPDQGPTYASLSIQVGGVQIRQAAATARNALLNEAATRLDVANTELEIAGGVVRAKSGVGQVTYGDLIGGKAFSLKVDANAATKDPAAYKIFGKPIPRLDIPEKVTGHFSYMQDFRVDGMLHGRVVRPPAIEAKLESVDESSVAGIPGVVQVVRQGNFLGVVAQTEWAAITAAQQIRATWSRWEGLPEQAKLGEHVRATKIAKDDVTSDVGDIAGGMTQGAKKLSATYDFAIHTHGSIGPSCAIAEIKEGMLTCWSASQATHNLRKQLGQMLSMPLESVRCVYIEGSGCYGRNGHEDAAGDAALLAQAIQRPVRVQWSRADEHGWDPKGPPTLIDLRAAMDASGNVTAWESEFFLASGAVGMVPLVAATLAGLPQDTALAPGNIIQNSALPYKFPAMKTICHRLESTPFRPSWIRTPGRLQNTYANEAFMDEVAAAAGADPLEFRLKYLDDPRGRETLERVAQLANWEKRGAPSYQVASSVAAGVGISYVNYELSRTYVACVAHVEVNRATGEIRVPRFFVAHDCGQIVNPDGVKNQIEGNVIQTLSRTLKEELRFDRSGVTSLDWESYPILKFPEIPEIIVELIDRPNEKPWGAGEPSSAVIPAAIANAVHDAVGARLRSVPFSPAKVKEAMRSI
jgi:CO/xanthine dehydrogenase Mo-binding subunit